MKPFPLILVRELCGLDISYRFPLQRARNQWVRRNSLPIRMLQVETSAFRNFSSIVTIRSISLGSATTHIFVLTTVYAMADSALVNGVLGVTSRLNSSLMDVWCCMHIAMKWN
jgi:hypothetical protein